MSDTAKTRLKSTEFRHGIESRGIVAGTQNNNIKYLGKEIQEYLDDQRSILNRELAKVLPPEVKKLEEEIRKAYENRKLISYLWNSSQKDKDKFRDTLELLKEMEEVGYLWP